MQVPLLMWIAFSVLAMFLFSSIDGAVELEGRVVDEEGFIGQVGVMVSSCCASIRLLLRGAKDKLFSVILANTFPFLLQVYLTGLLWIAFSALFLCVIRGEVRRLEQQEKLIIDDDDIVYRTGDRSVEV